MPRKTEWLDLIKRDIFEKYGVREPLFCPDEFGYNPQTISLENWVGNFDKPQWTLRYCRGVENVFYLKPLPFLPGKSYCELLIRDFLKQIYANADYPKDKIQFTIFGDCVYTEAEIRKELLYLLGSGLTQLLVDKQVVEDNGNVVLWLKANQAPLEAMKNLGLIDLEYFRVTK